MELNKLYTFKLETSYESRKLKGLISNTLESSETRPVYYMCRGFEVKKNENIVFTLLKKVKGGYISYFCNWVYGIGEFVLISDKELETIQNKWTIIENKEKFTAGNWRHYRFKDSIISEFVHPLDLYSNELSNLKSDLSSKERQLETVNKELLKHQKRFA